MKVTIEIQYVPKVLVDALNACAAHADRLLDESILEELGSMRAAAMQQAARASLTGAEPFRLTTSTAGIVRNQRDAGDTGAR